MANVTSLGIGSGIDLESLVTAYVNAEAVPQEIRLQEKEDRLSLELSGVGSFKSSLSSFNDILEKLTDADSLNKQTVTSSSTDISVTTNGFASNGSFSIEVEQLAQGSRLQSEATAGVSPFTSASDVVGDGVLTFDAGDGVDSFDVTITGTETLSDIRDKINENEDNFGVVANIISTDAGTFLTYSSTITGAANGLTVTTSDGSLDAISTNLSEEQSAEDGILLVDGNKITQETNEYKNVIEDVTITASKVNTGSPATLSIAQDQENGSTLINEFIAGYNLMMDDLTGLAAPKQGRLAFDPNVRQVKQQMADITLQAITTAVGGIDSLSDIGLELDSDGKLKISTFTSENIPSGQERLSDALENNLSEVGELFASSGGIATQMSELIDNYIASDGVLTQRTEILTERVSDIDDEWSTLEDRLRSLEERLRSQFTFLDTTVSQYNATSTWLASSLANITPQKDN